MKITSLGKVAVTTAGTPVQVTANAIRAALLRIELVPGNTGDIHVGLSTLNKTSGAGVVAVLTKAQADRWVYELCSEDGNSIEVSKFYLDSGTNGDAAYVSYGEV